MATKPVNLIINGEKTNTFMKINERNEGFFELDETELPEPNMRSGLQKLLDPSSQNLEVELSLCGDAWADTDPSQREELFKKHQQCPTEYIGNNGEEVGKDKFVYRVNGQYFRESEAWKLILGINICGTEVDAKSEKVTLGPKSNEDKKCASPNIEKLVSSLRPSSSSLKSFNLKDGENDLIYEYYVTEGVMDKVAVKAFVYSSSDKLIVSDIDGTITKSDVLGYILPAFGFNWHYHDLVSIYCKLQARGYKIVYLTARSFSEMKSTRQYIEDVKHGEFKLPRGPIFMYPKSFMSVLKTDIVTKTADIYKTRMLAEIQKAFKKANSIVSGFGNQVSDAVAYKSSGVHPNYVFHIKDSVIYMLSGKYKFSMEAFYGNVDSLFPEIPIRQ